MSDAGPAALTITTNDGGMKGDLLFGDMGKIGFLNSSNSLTISGQQFSLVPNIAALATAVSSNPRGNFALANDYDAGSDGTYNAPPVKTALNGEFEGLGNTIANLSIDDNVDPEVGLFAGVQKTRGKNPRPGLIRDLALTNVNVKAHKDVAYVGALGGITKGPLKAIRVSGSVTSTGKYARAGSIAGYARGGVERCISNTQIVVGSNSFGGGLFGDGGGNLSDSSATGQISGSSNSSIGGLDGIAVGHITSSFSSAAVNGKSYTNVGGLIGQNGAAVNNSYALGSVSGGAFSNSGGLIGLNYDANEPVNLSYAADAVSGGTGSFAGGFVGDDRSDGAIRADYWDTDATGQSQGAGNLDEGGMTGLTTQELQASLPAGFKKNIWAQDAKINNGYPYLIANPPPK